MKKPVEFESLSPNLVVRDGNASVDFYVNVLGFTLVQSVPGEGKYDWAMVQRGNVTMMFQTRESLEGDLKPLKFSLQGSPGTFYIRVKGIDDFFAALKGKSEVVVDMRTAFYGAREFAIKDPDGYYLMFAEMTQ